MPERVTFLGLTINLSNRAELLSAIANKETVRVATPNPEHVLEARHNPAFCEAYSSMTHCIIDGTGLAWYLRTFAKRLGITSDIELYHGSDLLDDLLKQYGNGSRSFYLIGGLPGASERAAEGMRERYPAVNVVGAEEGGRIDREHPLELGLIGRISKAQPDILIVGYGAPAQELWVAAAQHELHVPAMLCLGGAAAFYGSKRRAPGLFRALHLEWLWRSLTEKGHIKRAWRAVVVFTLYALSHTTERQS